MQKWTKDDFPPFHTTTLAQLQIRNVGASQKWIKVASNQISAKRYDETSNSDRSPKSLKSDALKKLADNAHLCLDLGISKNGGTPKSSILLRFSMIFTIHFGVFPIFWKHPGLMIWYSWKLPLSTSMTEPQGSSKCCRWWPSRWPSNQARLRESQGPTHASTCRPP